MMTCYLSPPVGESMLFTDNLKMLLPLAVPLAFHIFTAVDVQHCSLWLIATQSLKISSVYFCVTFVRINMVQYNVRNRSMAMLSSLHADWLSSSVSLGKTSYHRS